jgi:hypothetical protein
MAGKQSPFKALVQSQLDAPVTIDSDSTQGVEPPMQPVSQSPSQPVSQSLTGRRRGKSSDPNFLRMTVYVRRNTVEALEATNRELSEIVQEALDSWLQRR